LPPSTSASNSSGTGAIGSTRGGVELAIEIEFDQLFEAAEEEEIRLKGGKNNLDYPLSEEERLAMRRERTRCFYPDEI
jgi:hypothetical protein